MTNKNGQTGFSIVILLEEHSDYIEGFIHDLYDFFIRRKSGFEIIILANGTEPFIAKKLDILEKKAENIKIFSFYRKNTQAVCMKAALKEINYEIVVVCGSYQQISMEGLKLAIDKFDGKIDMVLPCRKKRVDPVINQFQSKFFNWIVRGITGYHFSDLSCTVRIIKKSALESIDFYGNMYRFLPLVAAKNGFVLKEIEVAHHKEMGKTGFYNISEYMMRILDIFSLIFLLEYTKKPFRFFSIIGIAFLSVGGIFISITIFEKLFLSGSLGNNLFLLTGFLFISVGLQSAGTGLLGEIITFTHGRKKKEYMVDKVVSNKFSGIERRLTPDRRKLYERRSQTRES
ncbi:MAG: hypothetical protein HUN04_14100 [Desulfobacter sp.]|nr:MAG: hypothetical protein HUN04_14100 [Desulfobacter sp.]